ncbi:MAG: hypothetical protein RJA61_311 [Candidatus Parcubacteria bacterium]|jgi:hypothetical protein
MPSSRILLLIASISVAGGLIFFATQTFKPQTFVPIPEKSGLIVEKALQNTSSEDTDQDGLKDWEEVLWGTDPSKADSDGDGENDGDEVIAGKNPKVTGAGSGAETISSIKNEEENLTETDKFSRAFFEEYLSLKQKTGASVSPITQENIIKELLENQKPFTFTTYSESDLFVNQDISTQALKQYGNAVGKAFNNNPTPAGQKHEIDIFEAAITSERAQDLAGLSPIIDSYAGTLKNLLSIQVPKTALSLHLNLINSMSAVVESITAMRSFFDDPISALPGIGAYNTFSKQLRNSFGAYQIFFLQKNVTFQQSEHGSLLMNTI